MHRPVTAESAGSSPAEIASCGLTRPFVSNYEGAKKSPRLNKIILDLCRSPVLHLVGKSNLGEINGN